MTLGNSIQLSFWAIRFELKWGLVCVRSAIDATQQSHEAINCNKLSTEIISPDNRISGFSSTITTDEERTIEFPRWTICDVRPYLWFFISNLRQRNIYCLISYSVFMFSVLSLAVFVLLLLGAGTSCSDSIQFTMSLPSCHQYTFKDKLSINFPCWKSSIASFRNLSSRSTAAS